MCDAASAGLLYWDATRDPRLGGMVLLNPWVRSEQTLAQARIRHYYLQRLLSADFWRKMLLGRFRPFRALGELLGNVRRAGMRAETTVNESFQQRMTRALEQFPADILVLLSEVDATAQEFKAHLGNLPNGRQLVDRPGRQCREIPEADHTFSSNEWRESVNRATIDWLRRQS